MYLCFGIISFQPLRRKSFKKTRELGAPGHYGRPVPQASENYSKVAAVSADMEGQLVDIWRSCW